MEQIKRQRNNIYDNDEINKRRKIQETTVEENCLSREIRTYFEDLSNEIIYEIFEYLDYFHVYKIFFNINLRFHNLIINSTLPIRINISSISKSDFNRYNKDIIMTNIDRINALRLSNIFIYDLIISPFHILSKFVRLERLILDNIESKYLENLLAQLIFLPILSSLSITCTNDITNRNAIYCEIFRLPSLKYCRLLLKEWFNNDLLPFCTNEYSSIEELIINNSMYLFELNMLLSYVPQLHRLSLHSLEEFWNKPTKLSPVVLNNLTYFSLEQNNIDFDLFEELIGEFFPSLQALHIRNSYISDATYLNAENWEKLILSHIPNLRIFDIRLKYWTNIININNNNNNSDLILNSQMNDFTSTFWIERKCFFAQQYYQTMGRTRAIFYSTDPYRRKYYTLYKQSKGKTCLNCYNTNMKSVEHLYIQSEKEIMNCTNYFPNVITLTFEVDFCTTQISVISILNHILPLKQLTKLVIECHYFSFMKMIELLSFTPNLHTLIFKSMPSHRNDYTSIQQNRIFQL
ncbi:unnamed protein product, partial [Rotaria sordida]